MKNHWVSVHGPGLTGFGPFESSPSYPVADPIEDAKIGEDGSLNITVAPRTSNKGVVIEKIVTFPKGSWTHVTRATTTTTTED